MRANSDPDAAVYYLARMIKGGEDPLFIARRMVIFASEDVGLVFPRFRPLHNSLTGGPNKSGGSDDVTVGGIDVYGNATMRYARIRDHVIALLYPTRSRSEIASFV
jgi:MgsA AAA+ ATPase C terminal